MTVPAGSHRLDVRKAGDPATAMPLVSSTFDTPAGRRASLLVHLGATGAPQVSIYDDDVAPIPAGQVRLVLRHGAAAGPVDFLLDGLPLVRALANTAQFASNQGAAAHELAITADRPGGAGVGSPPGRPAVRQLLHVLFDRLRRHLEPELHRVPHRRAWPATSAMQTGSGGSARSLADPAPESDHIRRSVAARRPGPRRAWSVDGSSSCGAGAPPWRCPGHPSGDRSDSSRCHLATAPTEPTAVDPASRRPGRSWSRADGPRPGGRWSGRAGRAGRGPGEPAVLRAPRPALAGPGDRRRCGQPAARASGRRVGPGRRRRTDRCPAC